MKTLKIAYLIIFLTALFFSCETENITKMSELTIVTKIDGVTQQDITGYTKEDFEIGYRIDFGYDDLSIPTIKSVVVDTALVAVGTWSDRFPIIGVIRTPVGDGVWHSFPFIKDLRSSGTTTILEVGADYFNATMDFTVYKPEDLDTSYKVEITLNNLPL